MSAFSTENPDTPAFFRAFLMFLAVLDDETFFALFSISSSSKPVTWYLMANPLLPL